MPSLVLELQQLATDNGASLTELLRKALLVATKLKVEEFKRWLNDELEGYAGPVPKYRQLHGSVMLTDRFGRNFPVKLDADLLETISEVPIFGTVAELEQHARSNSFLRITYPPKFANLLNQAYSDDSLSFWCLITPALMSGILDVVRSKVLNWSLELEEQGILGDGMTFSDDEKRKAAKSPSIHIGGNFSGVLGDVSGHNVQIGNYGEIHQQLKDAGIGQAERNELENIMDQLKTAKSEEKPSLVQKGMDWLGKNAGNLSAMTIAGIKAYMAAHTHS
jgi:hypothetical protein